MNRICGSFITRNLSLRFLSTFKPYNYKQQCEVLQNQDTQWHICKRSVYTREDRPDAGQKCYRCGKPGHVARECSVEKSCYRCGSVTHEAKNCPQSVCYRCMQPGHSARDCTEMKKCYKCGKPGHIAQDCQEVAREKAL